MKCQDNCGLEVPTFHPNYKGDTMLNIPYPKVKYLKHAGKEINVKVSLCKYRLINEKIVCLHIQDHEFTTFESALRFLQEESRLIVHESQDIEAA